jgi:CheY-like chemotaxis protein
MNTNNNEEVEIMLIDDNQTDVELTLRGLKKHNLANKVIVVNDGEEALDYIFSKGKFINHIVNSLPKVIFLDLKLPKINGLEVLRILKNDERAKLIPVVMLTSSDEESDIIESYKLGVNSYIVKPVDFENFTNSIAHLGMYWLLLNKAPVK